MFGLLIPLAVLALVVFGYRRARRDASALPMGQQVRLFFLYVILLAVSLLAAAGLAGSLGPLVDDAKFVADDANQTALNLAMLLIGVPLTVWLGLSTRKRLSVDRTEIRSFGWLLFVTVATIVPLIVMMFGAYRTLLAVVGGEGYDGFALSQAVVWGAMWWLVRWIDRRISSDPRTSLRHVVPATIGLGVSATALGQLVSGLVQRLFDIGAEAFVLPTNTQLHRGLALLTVGAVLWMLEWLGGLSREINSDAWRLVVVLFGVTGGLIAAISSIAVAMYHVAVWFLGSPSSDTARTHFESLPAAIGGFVAGLLAWWYHRSVLAQRRSERRAEVDRVVEHIMAAGGLVAGAFGVAMLIVAAIEAITGTRLVRGDDAVNTLLLAGTLLAIGAPVWLLYWRSTRSRDSVEERGSITRRVYLISVLGTGGLVALGCAIAAVYMVLRDGIEGRLDSSTLRASRFALAILLTSGVVAGYHVRIFRSEHTGGMMSAPWSAPLSAARPVPSVSLPVQRPRRRIVVAGPSDAALESALQAIPGVDIEWVTGPNGDWPIDETVGRVAQTHGDVVLVLTPSGVKVGQSLRPDGGVHTAPT